MTGSELLDVICNDESLSRSLEALLESMLCLQLLPAQESFDRIREAIEQSIADRDGGRLIERYRERIAAESRDELEMERMS